MDIILNNIDDIYKILCENIVYLGQTVNNTKELTNVKFTLTDINNNIINVRDISKPYLFGELTWYMNARQDMEFINKFASMWGRISDDGINSYSAYGHILFKRHGFNQVQKIIDLLKADRNTRRAVLNFNVPNINVIETKDEICTIALQLYIRNDKLYCTGIMRSNDIWYGLPYDLAFFTELQKYIAHRVGVKYGSYTHIVTSLHAYNKDFDKLKNVIIAQANEKISLDIEAIDRYKECIDKEICASDNPKKDVIDIFKKYGCFTIKNTINTTF